MPQVIVKLWPGKSEHQKKRLAEELTKAVMVNLNYGEESVSVGIEEIKPQQWTEKVYEPYILGNPETIYKKPDTIRRSRRLALRQVHPPERWRSASTTSAKAAEDWRRLG